MTAVFALTPQANAGNRLLYMPFLFAAVLIIVAVTAWLDYRDDATPSCPRCRRTTCTCPPRRDGA